MTVDNISADDAHTCDGGADEALLWVVEVGQVFLNIGLRCSADDGDAVVGFLPREADVQPRIEEGLQWKHLVGHFGFLQTEHIDVIVGHVIEHLWQADFEGVDIPRGEGEGGHVCSNGLIEDIIA